MLLQICLFALFSTQVFSQANYFVGYFNKLIKWPYPIGICASTGLGSNYVMYTCSWDGNMVNATTYKDSLCTNVVATTMYTPADMMYDGVHDFYCNGTNDYTEIELFLASCSSTTTLTTYSAVNTCYAYARTNTSYDVFQESQCTSTEATLSVYATEFDSCDSYYGYAFSNVSYTAYTTCGFYATQLGSAVYAKMIDCVYNDYSQLPVTKTNSAHFSGSENIVQYVDFYTSVYPTNFYYDPDLCSKPWPLLFEILFNGSSVTTTEACNQYTGYGYTGYDYFAGVDLWVHVDIFDTSIGPNLTQFYGCAFFGLEFELIIAELTHNNASVTAFNCSSFNGTTTTAASTKASSTSAPTTTASATTASISFVVVATLATILMYIL